MTLPARILLDTIVWLDAFDGARPRSRVANKLIDICEQKGIELLYAAGSAKDVYYLVGASLKRQARTTGEGLSDSQAQHPMRHSCAIAPWRRFLLKMFLLCLRDSARRLLGSVRDARCRRCIADAGGLPLAAMPWARASVIVSAPFGMGR